MRKLAILFLSALLMISLCSCKSKEAQNVDNLIMAIGEVSLEHEDWIEEAERAYSILGEKDKKKVEYYDVLVEARKAYTELERQKEVEEALEMLDKLLRQAKIEQVEELCYNLLNDEKLALNESEVLEVEEYLDIISRMCFAGTYIVMPQYIVDVSLELNAPSIKSVQDGGLGGIVCASCDLETSADLALAVKQYREYLNSCFEFIDSTCYSTGAEEYLYDYVRLNTIPSDKYPELQIWMTVGLFDLNKIDTSNPELTVADVDAIVIREK